jgi:phage-related protein
MEFKIEFYETGFKDCPVRDFLEALKASDPNDFAIIIAGINELRNRQYHRPPLSKSLPNDLYELRHVGKLNTRLFYFFGKGRNIILVHGIRNKGTGIPTKDMVIAEKRKADWEARNCI